MSELRTSLRATFGLEGDPFEAYSRRTHNWKPKFRALAAPPKELEAAMKEIEAVKRERKAAAKRAGTVPPAPDSRSARRPR